jgi:hypothetical protein
LFNEKLSRLDIVGLEGRAVPIEQEVLAFALNQGVLTVVTVVTFVIHVGVVDSVSLVEEPEGALYVLVLVVDSKDGSLGCDVVGCRARVKLLKLDLLGTFFFIEWSQLVIFHILD